MDALNVGNNRKKGIETWNNNHNWSIPERRGRIAIEDDVCVPPTSILGKLPVVSVSDAERYIEGLREFDIMEVGSSEWMEQQRILSQLNLQAHQSVMEKKDEFIIEALETYDKISVVIHELLVIEAWNEATLANFLEVILYHRHLCEILMGGLEVEVLDYCVRKVADLNRRTFHSSSRHANDRERKKEEFNPEDIKGRVEAMMNRNPKEDMSERAELVKFHVSVTAVTILRYLCEHMDVLPSNVHMRMVDVHDILMGIIPLLENPPWTKRLDTGNWEKFIDFQWQPVKPQDLLVLTKLEAQVWLIIYYFIMNENCRRSYHLDSLRKATMLRTRKYMNNILLDQLPILVDVQRYLDEIALLDVSMAPVGRKSNTLAGGVMVEEVASLRSNLVKMISRSSDDEIIDIQCNGGGGFSKDDAESSDLRNLCNVYETEGVEALFDLGGCSTK